MCYLVVPFQPLELLKRIEHGGCVLIVGLIIKSLLMICLMS